MAIQHAKPGEIVDVRPLGERLASSQTTTLVKNRLGGRFVDFRQ